MKELYRNSLKEAKRLQEIGKWRESHKENVRCRDEIDRLVSENFDGMHLNREIVKEICSEFGIDRTQWVLANTVKELDGDGRFRPDTQEWAKQICILPDEHNSEFVLRTHPEIANGLVGQFRRYLREDLGLMDRSDCVSSGENQSYDHQLLIIKPEILSEQYKTGQNQLFYATGGFGCSPSAGDKKVFGQFLNDGEKTHFYRSDFLGVADENKLPEWAVEKLEEIRLNEDQGMKM